MAGRRRNSASVVRGQRGAPIPSNALVASAVRYPSKAQRIYVPNQQWQRECYRQYAICGEARFAAQFFGHALSRGRLFVATKGPDGKEEVTEGPAVDQLAVLFNGKDGQEEMLSLIGIHLTIAGECYLVGRTTEEGDLWEVISIVEMKVTGTTSRAEWHIDYGDGGSLIKLDVSDDKHEGTDVVIRIWTPNPARRIEADSPFRSLLPVLKEIEWATKNIFAQLSSRLVGAGILLMPQEITFPPPPDVNGKPVVTSNSADGLMVTLAAAMMEAKKGDGSPAEEIPIVVTAPGEHIDKIKLLHFWSNLDEKVQEIRNGAVHRFAIGMDFPPEQMEGMSSSNGTGGGTSNGVSHWGAWQIEEATIKMHVEPMFQVVSNALTIGYMRPLLNEGAPEFVTYDSSNLRLRPDRSKEAGELYDRGQLSLKALLRENGFDSKDAPEPDELKMWILLKIASGSATPEMVAFAAQQLGVDMMPALPAKPTEVPNEARPAPSLEEHPQRELPERDAAALLMAVCEPLVYRALERAGNKLRLKGVKQPNVPSYETHTVVQCNGHSKELLNDAWPTASMCLDGIAEYEDVIPVLEGYVHALFLEQAPHTRERLQDWLVKGMAL